MQQPDKVQQQQQQQQQSGAAAARKARKPRGRGLRTTTGCAVCRKRHLKCDEVTPACGPCQRGNRQCVYGSLPAGGTANTASTASDPRASASSSSTSAPDLSQQQAPNPPPPPLSRQLAMPSHTERLPHPPLPPPRQQSWASLPDESPLRTTSPHSSMSSSTGYGSEVAPLRWLGLHAADVKLDLPSLETLADNALVQNPRSHAQEVSGMSNLQTPSDASNLPAIEGVPLQSPQLPGSARTPNQYVVGAQALADETRFWRTSAPIQLGPEECGIFAHYVTSVSHWVDHFDPLRHFSTFVPHLALHNEGLMKAVLALGTRHFNLVSRRESGDRTPNRAAAVQYYYETLQYLQSAMRFTSYKNSLELLATVMIVSTYEMIDPASKGWERHLKGVFWIQRSRNINGESGGFEQASWWAWCRQELWAAFREHRRCFSTWTPTKQYAHMNIFDMAARMVWILAQTVNYSSNEEKSVGGVDLSSRIIRANELLTMLQEWRHNTSIHFQPLPLEPSPNSIFKPLWIHPPTLASSLQMFSMARILLLVNQPAAGGYIEYLQREKLITESIDTIGGIAMTLTDTAARIHSTCTLFAAGLYCTDDAKRDCIVELIRENVAHTKWPSNTDLSEGLRTEWVGRNPG